MSISFKPCNFVAVERKAIIEAFAQLGEILRAIGTGDNVYSEQMGCGLHQFEKLVELSIQMERYNNWYTSVSVRNAFRGIGSWLTEEKLTEWSGNYLFSENPKNVALIMAGNIPLVGFHDVLCVLISGNIALCKLSSDDKFLMPAIKETLIAINPVLGDRMVLVQGKMEGIEAVIATGSNNSQNYFQQYFGKYPHIFRGNRTSVAVLTGNETTEELFDLGKDIFTYFGLGCRNVSHLIVPKGYKFDSFFEAIYPYGDIINHFKYSNNYDYNRAVHLLNLINLLDNNFILLRETRDLHSPLAMLFYHEYESQAEVDAYLEEKKEEIQVVVGQDYFPFGKAQEPTVIDYADNINTMDWLQSLN